MQRRLLPAVLAASLLLAPVAPTAARADNQMGYRLLTNEEAAGLPHNHGALGMDIERGQRITDSGMTFDIIRVTQVRRGSPGAQAGIHAGDQIVAVDGRVFASLAAFAGYVGSQSPGRQLSVDAIPAGGGPAQAERIAITVGGPGAQAAPQAAQPEQSSGGMSTRTKIGLGLVALFGCYELGCFSHKPTQTTPQTQR